MYLNQKIEHTLNKSFCIKGIGQHSGKIVKICVEPMDEGMGIAFEDMDKKQKLQLSIDNITANSGCSNIGNIHTIEHILSALSGMGIDNVIIKSWGGEIPICDGSSKDFTRKILSVGIKEQSKKRKYLKVLKDIILHDTENDSIVELHPNDINNLKCSVKIIYDTPAIGIQNYEITVNIDNYYNFIAPSRSFARLKDILLWNSHGFALGASLKTGIGVNDKKVLNKEGLRFQNEFARHKILDAIGDLRTCGYPIIGYYNSIKGGHYQNNLLVKKLLSDKNNYEIIEFN